jgi:hypothetical protein
MLTTTRPPRLAPRAGDLRPRRGDRRSSVRAGGARRPSRRAAFLSSGGSNAESDAASSASAAAQAKHEAARTRHYPAAHGRCGPLDELGRARVDLVRARIALGGNGGGDAPSLLLDAAKRLEPLDLELARDTYLEAVTAAEFAGRLGQDADLGQVARAAHEAPPPTGPPRASDLLLDGLATRFTDGYAAGGPILKRALGAFRSDGGNQQ